MTPYTLFLWILVAAMGCVFAASFCSAFAFWQSPMIEGLENASAAETGVPEPGPEQYQAYNVDSPNNALILAQQNAGNISYLKQRMDEVAGVARRVDTMQQNIDLMQSQMDALVQQQAEFAQDLAGGSEPPTITGTGEEEEEDVV